MSSLRPALVLLLSSQLFTYGVFAQENQSREQGLKELAIQYESGDLVKAQAACRRILVKNPRDLTARYYLGNIYVKQNRLDLAAREYDFCLSNSTKDPQINDLASRALAALKLAKEQPPITASPASTLDKSTSPDAVEPQTSAAQRHDEEEIARITKDGQDQIAVKQKVLDEAVNRLQEEMKTALANVPMGRRRNWGAAGRESYLSEIRDNYQGQIDHLKEEFERSKAAIEQSYQSRIDSYNNAIKNLQQRREQPKFRHN